MPSDVFPNMITIVNAITLLIISWLTFYCYRKCFVVQLTRKDHIFYSLKLKKCIVFFIFNGIAMYVNWRIFSLPLGNIFPYDLVVLRYIDRATVLIYALVKVLDVYRYYPTAYDKFT